MTVARLGTYGVATLAAARMVETSAALIPRAAVVAFRFALCAGVGLGWDGMRG